MKERDQGEAQIRPLAQHGWIGERRLDRALDHLIGHQLIADLHGGEAAEARHVGDDAE